MIQNNDSVVASLAHLGQHFTPPLVARWLVEVLLEGWDPPSNTLHVVDPACGEGALLEAVASVLKPPLSGGSLLGIEVDPEVKRRCAERLRSLSPWDVAIVQGDALAAAGHTPLEEGSADLVVMNPPYIGEKGHRALFRSVAALGPRWKARTVGRMDYLYYFIHLGLDLLRPGGRMMALTTAYWPSATSGRALRKDLMDRGAVLRWVRFDGASPFKGAPGQHNVAVVVERCKASSQVYGWRQVRVSHQGDVELLAEHDGLEPFENADPWQPFQTVASRRISARRTREWTPLGTLVTDRQGVVSGCDRVTKRHRETFGVKAPAGSPVFLFQGDALRAKGWHHDPEIVPLLRPVLRGATIGRLDQQQTTTSLSEADTIMLYLDRTSRDVPAAVLRHLKPVRAVLEARREVREGKIPWWSLHWPRRLHEMLAPKLVTARRGDALRFCLDLGGHVLSSDCTYLVPGKGWSMDDLVLLWHTLHLPEVYAQMEAVGKRKGSLFEFYSEPLRRLAVPLRWECGLVSLEPDRIEEVRAEMVGPSLIFAP